MSVGDPRYLFLSTSAGEFRASWQPTHTVPEPFLNWMLRSSPHVHNDFAQATSTLTDSQSFLEMETKLAMEASAIEAGMMAMERVHDADNALFLTSSNCHFCRESLPFYRALVARARTSDVRVVGVTREDPEVNRAYLWANGVLVDAVLSGIDIGVPTERTPTLIVIPRVGLGKGWVGKLSKERQAEVDGYFETVVAGRQE